MRCGKFLTATVASALSRAYLALVSRCPDLMSDTYEDFGPRLLSSIALFATFKLRRRWPTAAEIYDDFPDKSDTSIRHHLARLIEDGLVQRIDKTYEPTEDGWKHFATLAKITLQPLDRE